MVDGAVLDICTRPGAPRTYAALVAALTPYYGGTITAETFAAAVQATGSFCVAAALLPFTHCLPVHDLLDLADATGRTNDMLQYLRLQFDNNDKAVTLVEFVTVAAHLLRKRPDDVPAAVRIWLDARIPSQGDFFAALSAALAASGTAVPTDKLRAEIERAPHSTQRSAAFDALEAQPDSSDESSGESVVLRGPPVLVRLSAFHAPVKPARQISAWQMVKSDPASVTNDVLQRASPMESYLLVAIAQLLPRHATWVVARSIQHMLAVMDIYSVVHLLHLVWDEDRTVPDYGLLAQLAPLCSRVLRVLQAFPAAFQVHLLYALAFPCPDNQDAIATALQGLRADVAGTDRALIDEIAHLDSVAEEPHTLVHLANGGSCAVYTDYEHTIVVKEMANKRREIEEITTLRRLNALAQTHSAVRHCTVQMIEPHTIFAVGRRQGIGILSEYGGVPSNKVALWPSGGVIFALCQLVLAVRELNTNGLYHNDIKDNNVLFDATANRLVLIDFGFGNAAYNRAVLDSHYQDELQRATISRWTLWHPWQLYLLYGLQGDGYIHIAEDQKTDAYDFGSAFCITFLDKFSMSALRGEVLARLPSAVDAYFAAHAGESIKDLLQQATTNQDPYGVGVFAAHLLTRTGGNAKDILLEYLFGTHAQTPDALLGLLERMSKQSAIVGASGPVHVNASHACLFPLGNYVLLKVFNSAALYDREQRLYARVRDGCPALAPEVVDVHTTLWVSPAARTRCAGLARHDAVCGVELAVRGAVALTNCLFLFRVDEVQDAAETLLRRVATANAAGIYNLGISPDTVFVSRDGALSLPQWSCGTDNLSEQHGRSASSVWLPWQLHRDSDMAALYGMVMNGDKLPHTLLHNVAAAQGSAHENPQPAAWWAYADVYAVAMVVAHMLRRHTTDGAAVAHNIVAGVLSSASPLPLDDVIAIVKTRPRDEHVTKRPR